MKKRKKIRAPEKLSQTFRITGACSHFISSLSPRLILTSTFSIKSLMITFSFNFKRTADDSMSDHRNLLVKSLS